jgi:hypothetical protein
MANTYGPTGEGVKPKLGSGILNDAQPGGGAKVPGSPSTDIPKFAQPASSDAGERKPKGAGAAPEFAGPGGAQGWTHGKK